MFEVKDALTVQNILKRVDEYSIFKSYCHNFNEIDKPFVSELRKEDIPSCRIIYSRGRLWYKDFGEADKMVDCFGYIMKKYSLNFIQALGVVNTDFNLGLQQGEILKPSLNLIGLPDKPEYKEKSPVKLKVKNREWTKGDVDFWRGNFHIEKETLDIYNTAPVKYFFVNDTFINAPKLCYASLIDMEDSEPIYKIYSPFDKTHKWISNCKANHYLGYNQLPWLGEILIVTKSLKDVMELYQFGYNSIAPQSESQLPTDEFIRKLYKRFNKIIVFFDNDVAGIKGAERISTTYNLPMIMLPQDTAKDISDYVKLFGVEQGKDIMNRLLNV